MDSSIGTVAAMEISSWAVAAAVVRTPNPRRRRHGADDARHRDHRRLDRASVGCRRHRRVGGGKGERVDAGGGHHRLKEEDKQLNN